MIKSFATASLALGLCVSASAQGSFKVQTTSTAQGIKLEDNTTFISGAGFLVSVLVNGTVLFDSQAAVVASSGRINNQTAVVTPSVLGGSSPNMEVRVWSGAASFALASTTPGARYGSSGVFAQLIGGDAGGGNSLPVQALTAMPGFTLALTPVPEPSVIALAGLGLGGLVLARRSKKA